MVGIMISIIEWMTMMAEVVTVVENLKQKVKKRRKEVEETREAELKLLSVDYYY